MRKFQSLSHSTLLYKMYRQKGLNPLAIRRGVVNKACNPPNNRTTKVYWADMGGKFFEGECADGGSSYYCEDFRWEDLRDEMEKLFVNECQQEQSSKSVEGEGCCSNKDAWESFHKRHPKGTFFKERRYLLKEFPELLTQGADGVAKVLEVGCGNGSSILPILRANDSIVVYACDCSMAALDRAREMVDAATGVSGACRFNAFYCDFSLEAFPTWLCCISCRESFQAQEKNNQEGTDHPDASVRVEGCNVGAHREVDAKEIAGQSHKQCCIGGVDVVTLIFTLSSIPLKRMPHVIKECFSVLKPGGMLFFRDYGLYDMTMLRFPHTQNIGDRQYVRGDGTLSYYFSLEILRDLFTSAGFVEIEIRFCCVQLVNRRKGQKMRRVWIHGKFQKPSDV